MISKNHWTLVSVLAVGLVSATPHAGVTVYGDKPPVTTLINGTITDGSDPISWQPMGPITPGSLDGSGEPPYVAWRAATAWPVVVWAADGAVNHDVVFSEWDGTGWTSQVYLTSGASDETDPHIFVDGNGSLHVAWSKAVVPGEVQVTSRPAGVSTWQTAVTVSSPAENARRPSVAVVGGSLWVAYERDSTAPGMAQDIVLARRKPNGTYERSVLLSTPRSEALDVMLHVQSGSLWVDWIHSDQEFGRAEFVGGDWATPTFEPWTDHSWVGVETIRRIIMQQVTN